MVSPFHTNHHFLFTAAIYAGSFSGSLKKKKKPTNCPQFYDGFLANSCMLQGINELSSSHVLLHHLTYLRAFLMIKTGRVQSSE